MFAVRFCQKFCIVVVNFRNPISSMTMNRSSSIIECQRREVPRLPG